MRPLRGWTGGAEWDAREAAKRSGDHGGSVAAGPGHAPPPEQGQAVPASQAVEGRGPASELLAAFRAQRVAALGGRGLAANGADAGRLGAGIAAQQPGTASSPAGPVTSDGADNTINGSFIRAREGFTTDGYVPKDKDGNVLEGSGVTVGNGVDLGAQSAEKLRALGVDEDTIKALSPYFGKKRQAAVDALKAQPLSLSQQQTTDLSNRFLKSSAEEIATRFNKSQNFTRFADLPGNTKTMLVDIYHQYGPQLFGYRFWKQVTTGDWQGAHNNLMNFDDEHPTRRRLEAGLLFQDIQRGNLPNPSRQGR